MYAVVEAGGRQYQLTSGQFIDVDMVAGEADSQFVFDRVLMIVNGKESLVGKPLVDGAKVTGKIITHGKGKKLVVYKYRPKKGTRKRTGHRQGFTRIFVDSIEVNGKVVSKSEDNFKKSAKGAATEKTPAPKAKKTADEAPAKAEKAPAKKAKATAETAETKTPKKTTKKKESE